MPIVSATTAKSYFETGDKPTQAEFTDLIDSAMRDPIIAIANQVQAGATGVVKVVSTTEASLHSAGAFGLQMLGATTTADGLALLPTSTVSAAGWSFIAKTTVAGSVAGVTFDNIFASASPFHLYKIKITNMGVLDQPNGVQINFVHASSTFTSTSVHSYHYSKQSEIGLTYNAIAATGAGTIILADTSGGAGPQLFNAEITIFDPFYRIIGSAPQIIMWQYVITRASAGIFEGFGGGACYNTTQSAAQGIRIGTIAATNSLKGGSVTVYGLTVG